MGMDTQNKTHRHRSILAHEHLLGDKLKTWTKVQKRLDAELKTYIRKARESNVCDEQEFADGVSEIIEKYPSVVVRSSVDDDEDTDFASEGESATGLEEYACTKTIGPATRRN